MRRIDITSKLELETSAILVIEDMELEIRTDTKTALLLMDKLRNGANTREQINEVTAIMFTEESKAKLDAMNLSYKDYKTVIGEAIAVINSEESQGEDQTRTTT